MSLKEDDEDLCWGRMRSAGGKLRVRAFERGKEKEKGRVLCET